MSCLADAPLNERFKKQPTHEQLLATLSSTCFASVRLYYSYDDEQWPPPPPLPPRLLTRLARSASTLTALHHLPLVKPWEEPSPDDTGRGLAALTRLRALTLRQTWEHFAELRAGDLPPSLEDLKLVMQHPRHVQSVHKDLPLFVDFDMLHNLRRLTLAEYWAWGYGGTRRCFRPAWRYVHRRSSDLSAEPFTNSCQNPLHYRPGQPFTNSCQNPLHYRPGQLFDMASKPSQRFARWISMQPPPSERAVAVIGAAH